MLWHFCVKINENLFALCYWAATEAEAGAGAGARAAALTFCWALFSLRSVRYVTLRFVSFIRSFRFSVCPKTFFHMHLSAKACHIPLLPTSPTHPYVSTRHNSLRLWGPLSVWKCSVVCHFSQNFKYSFFPQLILWDAVQVRAAAVAFCISCSALFCYFSLPLSPLYPRYAISQADLGHFERLIIWQLVCEVSHKARHGRPFANPYRWAVERCPRAYERHDDWPNSRHTSWSWYTCLASLQSGNAAASLEFRHRKCDRSVKKSEVSSRFQFK